MRFSAAVLVIAVTLSAPAFSENVTHILTPSVEASISAGVVTPESYWLPVRGTSGTTPEKHAVAEFSLIDIDLNLPVQSATLNFLSLGSARSDESFKSMNVYVHGYAGDNQVTPDDDLIDNPVAGPFHTEWRYMPTWPDMSAIDVTPLVQNLLANGAEAAGFVLKPLSFYGSGFLELDITAAPNGFATSRYPVLTITQVPEPAGPLVLAAAGVIGLCGVRRR